MNYQKDKLRKRVPFIIVSKKKIPRNKLIYGGEKTCMLKTVKH